MGSAPSKNSESYFVLLENLLSGIWPLLEKIILNPFKRETDEDKVVEQAIKLIKIILRAIPDQFLKYMHPISHSVVESYQKHPISSFVYYYELLLTQYRSYSSPELSAYLLHFFQTICQMTFKHVQEFGGVNNLSILT